MGFLSDVRNDGPELAGRIADGLESILYLGDPGNSVTTTPTTLDSREIAASVGVDFEETPVLRDTTSVPKLTEDQMRKAFSIIPTDYWQLNCWTCRECGPPTFTCPTLTAEQRMYYIHQYYLDQVRTNPTMASFLPQKTTTIGPSERTSSQRKDHRKQRPKNGTGRNDGTPEPEHIPSESKS